MDALALLCNLHADGPTTLDELHRIGVRGLEDVLGARTAGIVTELGWNHAAAERFVREAGHLRARLGETLSDPEEATWARRTVEPETLAPAPPQNRPEPALDSTVAASIGARPAAGDFIPDPRTNRPAAELPPAATLELASKTITATDDAPRGGVDLVLQRWRELDEFAPPIEPRIAVDPVVVGTPISSNVQGALDTGSLERLSQMGIVTLEQLLDTPALELARGLRTGFSRATRLQFLARRSLEQSPNPCPVVEPGAGPFAGD